MRSILAGIAMSAVLLCGCETVETAADHARDFAEAHPVAVSVGASILVSSAVTTIAMHQAKKQLSEQMSAALAGEGTPPQKTPTTVLLQP